MAFRRQDIPKTTRSTAGGPRRLYPRYAKDKALLPRIELAIGYLDGMVGRRRSDLAPDAVIDLFGDPKLARCMVSCLTDSYRYRIPRLAEALGDDAANALAKGGMTTPARVRAEVYHRANRDHNGFAAGVGRDRLMGTLAAETGVSSALLEEALHLDAERNHVLVRVGERPRAEDVRARYNALLTLSVLRHASEITLVLPGLDAATVHAACARDSVPVGLLPDGEFRLSGRRGATGSWSQFGIRVARCALRLMLLSPRTPQGSATVHLADRSLVLALDGSATTAVRPKQRAATPPDAFAVLDELLDSVAVLRKESDPSTAGWTLRRASEPLVVADAVVLPDLVCLRDDIAVAVAVLPSGAEMATSLPALEAVAAVHPVVAVGNPNRGSGSLRIVEPEAAALFAALDAVARQRGIGRSTLGVLLAEVEERGWVGEARLGELLGDDADIPARVQPLTGTGETAMVPGVGLCRAALLAELDSAAATRSLDVGALRDLVGARLGEGPAADAMTLHLLRQARVSPPSPLYEQAALLPTG